MKVKDIIKELQKYEDQDYQLVYSMFSESDVRDQVADMEAPSLTEREVREVIEYLERNADATEGMSWETVEYAISQVKGQNEQN